MQSKIKQLYDKKITKLKIRKNKLRSLLARIRTSQHNNVALPFSD